MANDTDTKPYTIEARGLIKSFGNFPVLTGLDLKIGRGEFYTLFGPNGAGKTTFLKILSSLTKADSGTLRINGFDAPKQASDIRASLGVVWHEPCVYDNLSAHENIVFFGTMYGVSDVAQKADDLLEQLGLVNRRHDLTRTYSRGMKQRLALARAIIHDPPVLLLDEPYTGLDRHGAQIFGELLQKLYSRNRTIVMTTHNMDEGLELSTRAGILVNGNLVAEAEKPIDKSEFRELYLSKVQV